MTWWPSPLEDALICYISDRLCEGAEVRWRLGPAHWQGEGKGNERFFAVKGWERYTKLGDVLGLNSNQTEPIGHVDFDLFDRPIPRIGVNYLGH
jgi:hypothetical protein